MGSVQERMEASGFLNGEELKNRTVCAPFYLHRSSRVLRGKSVQIGSFFCQSTENIVKRVYFLDAWTVLSVDCIYLPDSTSPNQSNCRIWFIHPLLVNIKAF